MKTSVDNIIRNHILVSMGVGLIPLPIVDVVVLMGVQLNMLRKLSKTYNIPFSRDKGKHFIASLMGSSIPVSLSGSAASLVKAVPIVGQTTGALTMVALSGAATYAVGKVFTQHFESGGTFLDFDPETVKAYYAQMLKEGEKIVADIKNGNGAKKEDSISESEKIGEEKIPSAESEETDKEEEKVKENAVEEPLKNGDKKKEEKENSKAAKNGKTGKSDLNYP